MITATQIRVARVSLGLSVAGLAELAGCAPNTIWAIERGANHKASTARILAETLMSKGIVFFSDNMVGQRMEWPNVRPSDPRVAEAALSIINAGRSRDGRCAYIDEGE